MQYLLLENVSRSYGDKVLFNNVNLSISKGDKIALVAKNGSGKTTLLKVISGEEGSDGENANIVISKDIKTAMLRQEPVLDENATVLEACFDSENEAIIAVRDYERAVNSGDEQLMQKCMTRIEDLKAWDLEARIHEILDKLRLSNLEQKVGQMSGGQKKRLALAKILIEEPDFLILDEPTNHLDIDMIEWLETYLQHPGLTLFMVTHDRYFLERVCNEIIELDNGQIYVYRGNYSDYLEKREARKLNDAVNLEKTKKLFSKELEWMRRQPQARSTKAKSRIDDFYEIKEKASARLDNDEMKINIASSRLGSKILEAHAIVKKYDDKNIINSFSYKFKKGERIGLVGPNGAGKSTFLKILTQQIEPDGGKIVIGDTIVFGYYTQDGLIVNENKMVVDVIRDIAEYIPLEKGQKLSAESLLERFLFPRAQQRVLVSQLSGGEKRRLYLLTILMKNPNFLILDEPTNDLDILTLNVLEDYLMDFPGCLIIVTHDRYFMDKLVDHIFVLEGEGDVNDYNGTYSEYRIHKKDAERKLNETKSETDESIQQEESKGKLNFEQRKEVARIEKEIQKLEEKRDNLTAKFDDITLSPEKIMEYSKALDEVNILLVEKENKWFELSEML
ncbi:MAG TPA: ABC-F family ATP-binding cassette domain-containing protein [Saprospiraceae bacterium]|nr:ABC-F family ATP-binding cassette domain-containing protein [Saprospiraceae bacterium]HRO09047.1 ABC-F family ATP-binding cassette domain-containing protein [Saprospiraceae bacterium]HRP42394.1 ABC-F family ATP-binding cassette domain-containing protein [Saprospiraceae bacterium]